MVWCAVRHLGIIIPFLIANPWEKAHPNDYPTKQEQLRAQLAHQNQSNLHTDLPILLWYPLYSGCLIGILRMVHEIIPTQLGIGCHPRKTPQTTRGPFFIVHHASPFLTKTNCATLQPWWRSWLFCRGSSLETSTVPGKPYTSSQGSRSMVSQRGLIDITKRYVRDTWWWWLRKAESYVIMQHFSKMYKF